MRGAPPSENIGAEMTDAIAHEVGRGDIIEIDGAGVGHVTNEADHVTDIDVTGAGRMTGHMIGGVIGDHRHRGLTVENDRKKNHCNRRNQKCLV